MNEIKTIGTEPSSPFLELASDTLTSSIVGERLKFDRGRWIKGQDEAEMSREARLLVNMPELQIGWVKFTAGKPESHRMGRVRTGFKMPERAELGDDEEDCWENGSDGLPKDPWSQTYIVLMRDMDTSELLTFLTNSKGGLQAMARLCQAYALGGYEDGGLCPVVALGGSQYQHPNPSFGKIWTPRFQITSWVPWTGAVAGQFGDAVRDIPPSEIKAARAYKAPEVPDIQADLDDEVPF